MSWTNAGSDDAFLTLDRNGNGSIDDGAELFGDSTLQPAGSPRHGFRALATFDDNADGWIDNTDSVYSALRLWTDANHDGVSQPAELRGLALVGVLRISLDVKESGRRDGSGNAYRYRAKIQTANPRDGGPYAYDVLLTVAPPAGTQSAIAPPWLKKLR